jgi:O-antigen ligase
LPAPCLERPQNATLELILISSIPQQSRLASWRPGFYLALVYIFATYTRLPEFVSAAAGHSLRLGLIITVLAVLAVLISGSLYRIFSSKIVLALMAFTGWLFISAPFSIWRGGSASQVLFWCVSVVSLILLAGCIEGAEQCRKAGYAMAVSVLGIEVLSFFLGSSAEGTKAAGRLAFVSGTFANPNDLAALLLMGLPFCLLVVRTRSGLSVLKVACILGIFLIPLSVVRTGSRGGLLALLIMFVLYFFSVPSMQKIPLVIAALLLAVAAVLFSSSSALDRYKTIFRSGDTVYYANAAEKSAELSTSSRKALFLSSVRLTIQHPLLGVGPGMFQIADAKDAAEKKQPAAWHQTHNAYTQISCESGLPALFFYVAALFYCFKAARAVRQGAAAYPELRPYGDMAFSLRLSLIAFTITAIFASNAYYFFFPMLAGLCAALERSVRSEMQALKGRQDGHPRPPAPPGQRIGYYPPAGQRRAMPSPANYRR